MAAFGALGLMRARRLTLVADIACALSLEALQGSRTAFLPAIHAARPLPGQIVSAANVLALLEGSAINEGHRWCDKVQDAYSLRCAPQVHGASRDLLAYVEATVATELNAATDNPLVLVDEERLVSNGNFHGQPLAFALDALAMAVSELASISERRVERLVNPTLSEGLPPFLTADGGLNSGFMIPQVTAAALVSENKQRAYPASVDSIPTSANQEDHVSMACHGARRLLGMTENLFGIIGIEALTAAQGVELRAPLSTSPELGKAITAIRTKVPSLDVDRYMANDLAAAAELVATGALNASVSSGILPVLEG
jgi:histidine ammonia-lyase